MINRRKNKTGDFEKLTALYLRTEIVIHWSWHPYWQYGSMPVSKQLVCRLNDQIRHRRQYRRDRFFFPYNFHTLIFRDKKHILDDFLERMTK